MQYRYIRSDDGKISKLTICDNEAIKRRKGNKAKNERKKMGMEGNVS